MNIAIIGSGNVGSALARSLSEAGHRVTLAASDPEKTRRVAEENGVSAADAPADAAASADTVVVAVPYAALADVADAIRPAVDGKVVIDVTNPLTPDYSALVTAGGPSAAEQLAQRLPEARVVKAFNTLFASVQVDPGAFDRRLDALIAADDDEAREAVAGIIESIGLRPIDVGPLARARELEALAFLNISLQMRHGGDWRSTFVLVGAPARAIQLGAAAAA